MKCQALCCHCQHRDEAEYVVTFKNGDEEPVSKHCATMHVMAGVRSRRLSMGDVMSGKFVKRVAENNQ